MKILTSILIYLVSLDTCASFILSLHRYCNAKPILMSDKYEITVILNGSEKKLSISGADNILSGLLDSDYKAPHSCRSGLCTECAAFVEEGMENIEFEAAFLDPKVADLGFILTCSAKIKGTGVKLKLGAGEDMYEAQYGEFVTATHRNPNKR